jgi:hypothetical protein
MRELTDCERDFLRTVEKQRGGTLTIQGIVDHRKWDYLVEEGYLGLQSASMDAVAYTLTEKGRAALAK